MLSLNLIVLSSENIEKTKDFYMLLGLVFQEEQHGKSPVHYSCEINNVIIEVYPASEKFPVEKSVRLGFKLDNFSEVKERLIRHNISIKESKGIFSIEDPEGRKVYIE